MWLTCWWHYSKTPVYWLLSQAHLQPPLPRHHSLWNLVSPLDDFRVKNVRSRSASLFTTITYSCCCYDSPAALLLSSVVQVEEVCDCSRVVPRHRSCTVSCIGWLWQLNRCSTECGATPHSGQMIWYAAGDAGLVTVQKPTVTSTQLGESGTDWPRQQTFKLQGLCLVQNSFLLLRLLSCREYVDSHGKYQHLWCLHLRAVEPRSYTSSACPSCFSLWQLVLS